MAEEEKVTTDNEVQEPADLVKDTEPPSDGTKGDEFDADQVDLEKHAERYNRMLEGVPMKKRPTNEVLARLVQSDPESAAAVKNILDGYQRNNSKRKEWEESLKKEKEAFTEARRRFLDEQDRFNRAVKTAGFSDLKLPEVKTPENLPNLAEAFGDPDKFFEAVNAHMEAKLEAKLAERMKPFVDPLRNFGAKVDEESRRVELERFREANPDFNVLLPIMKDLREKDPDYGQANYRVLYRAAKAIQAQKEREDGAKRASEERARAEAAASAGRGSAGRPSPVIPPEIAKAGGRAHEKYYQSLLDSGYTHDEILEANRFRGNKE